MKDALALVASILALTGPAFGQSLLLQNSGAPGCGGVTLPAYKGATSLASFSVGGALPATTPGSPETSGKLTLSNLVLTKTIDNCSVSLMTEFLSGQMIDTLTLTELKNSDVNSGPILIIVLKGAQIVSYNVSDTNGASKAVEQLAITFLKATITSVPYDSNGNPGTPVTINYDATLNRVFPSGAVAQ